MKKTRSTEETLEELFEKLGITLTQVVREERGNQVFYVTHTPDGALFQNQGGEGVRALTVILRQLCLEEETRFSVDINGAQVKRVDGLRNQAIIDAAYRSHESRRAEAPRTLIHFEIGERVKVNDGPFEDFDGMVEGVDEDNQRLSVSVSIFGRETPVELDFTQVSKQG